MNLTRNLFIPFVDAKKIRTALGETVTDSDYIWTQIDKSTIFDLAFNPQEETSGYIDMANDTTYVKSYQAELPQEIILDSDNPLFKIMFPFCMAMPTGGDAEVPVLLIMPDIDSGQPTVGYMWEKAIVSPTDLNTVDGKLNFSLKLNGDAVKGTVAFTDGKPTFTANTNDAGEPETLSFASETKSTSSTKSSDK